VSSASARHPVDSLGKKCLLLANMLKPAAADVQGHKSTVVLYSAHDPFLFAANLTNGGMVLAEDRINEVALGMTSSVFGVVLMIPFIMLKIITFLANRKKDEQAQTFDDIPFYACEVDKN
jgi:hypothetical protein